MSTGADGRSDGSGPPSPCLLGYAAIGVRAGRRLFVFGHEDLPRLRVEPGLGPFTLSLRLDGRPVHALPSTEVDEGVAFVTLHMPPGSSGEGRLVLESERGAFEWAVEWTACPDADDVLAEVRALRSSGRCAEALDALEAVERGRLEPRAGFWVVFERGRILRAMSRVDEATRVWQEAAQRAMGCGILTWASRALRAAAYLRYQARGFEEALSLLERAAAIDTEAEDFEGRINTAFYRGMVANERGALVEARRHYDRALALGRACRSDRVDFFETLLGLHHLELGEFEEARRIAMRIPQRLATGSDDLHYQVGERYAAAWILTQCHHRISGIDVALVDRLLDEALARARAAGERQLELVGLLNRTWMAWWAGDLTGAKACLGAFRARLDSPGRAHPGDDTPMSREYDLLSGLLCLASDALGEAEVSFRQLLDRLALETAGAPSQLVVAGWLGLARVARRRHAPREAEEAIAAAMSALTEMALDLDRRRAVSLLRDRPLLCDPLEVIDEAVDLAWLDGRPGKAFAAADALYALRRRELDQRSVLASLGERARAVWDEQGRRLDALRQAYDETFADWSRDPERRSAKRVALAARLQAVFDERLRVLESSSGAPRRRVDAADVIERLATDEALILLRTRSTGTLEAWWLSREGVLRAESVDLAEWLRGRLDGVEHLYVVGDQRSGAWRLPERVIDGLPLAARVGLSFPGCAGALGADIRGEAGASALVVTDPLDDLAAARRDTAHLARVLGSARSLSGSEAHRGAVLAALTAHDVFHFSGHGELDADRAGVTLKLAGQTTLRPEDIVGLDPIPRRVVLNGCRTAVGFMEQAVSLPGAFLTAGAASVLGTVRPVRDARASAFVRRFYARDGVQRPAAALRDATRWAISQDDDVWRAYRLMGRR